MARKVNICGIDTSSLPKITAQESRNLLIALQNGDEQAKEYFVRANLRLVLAMVQRFDNRNVNSDDLFQVGCVGLMKSIKNFDTSLNVMFSTYAVPMILGEIRRFMRDRTGVKVSRGTRDLAYQIILARYRLSINSETSPSMAEIASELDIPVSAVNNAMDAISEPVSIFDSVYSEGDDNLLRVDQLCECDDPEQEYIEKISLNDAIRALPEMEKKVIKLRYYLGHTQMEISKEIDISQAQVSRLEKSALQKMKKFFY